MVRPRFRDFHSRSGGGEGARDGGDGVSVGREGDGVADGLLVGFRLQPAAEGLRDGHIAVVAMVSRTADLLDRSAEIISEGRFHIVPDLGLVMPGPGQIDTGGDRLCAADAFVRVMTDLGCLPGQVQGLLQRTGRPAARTDAHGTAVGIAAVWPMLHRTEPRLEAVTVTGMWMAVA